MKYIVKIASPEVRETLAARFEKVGKPTAIPDYIIVTTDKPMSAIQAVEGVLEVTPDGMADLSLVDLDPPGWGLPWISNSAGTYENKNTGEGVDIYILDTGVRDTHVDLAGRVENLYSHDDVFYNVTGGPSPTHGTSVAACAAGTRYGTAKKATIVNCRVDFTFVEITKALDTILYHHLHKDAGRPSIVNFSGGSSWAGLGDMFARLTQYGVVVAAAAGNSGPNAPKPEYPARHKDVLSVGASWWDDTVCYFSNRSADIYAPGAGITTAHVFTDTSETKLSGTSFSCPYVCGLMGCVLEGSDRFNTLSHVRQCLDVCAKQLADKNRVKSEQDVLPPVMSGSTKVLPEPGYINPSRMFTDHEINTFCAQNLDNLQVIADAVLEYNVDLNRLVKATNHSAEEINGLFNSAGVKTWWMV